VYFGASLMRTVAAADKKYINGFLLLFFSFRDLFLRMNEMKTSVKKSVANESRQRGMFSKRDIYERY
jgi:hypothetical protein